MAEQLHLEAPPQSDANDQIYEKLFTSINTDKLGQLLLTPDTEREGEEFELQLKEIFGDDLAQIALKYLSKLQESNTNISNYMAFKNIFKPVIYRALNILGKKINQIIEPNHVSFYKYYPNTNRKDVKRAFSVYHINILAPSVEIAIKDLVTDFENGSSDIPPWVMNAIKINQIFLYNGDLREDPSLPTDLYGSIWLNNILAGLNTAAETIDLVPMLYKLIDNNQLTQPQMTGIITAFISGLTKFDVKQIGTLLDSIDELEKLKSILELDTNTNSIRFRENTIIYEQYGYIYQTSTSPDGSKSLVTLGCPFRGGGNIISLLIHPIVAGMVQILLKQSTQNQNNTNKNKI